MNITNKELEQLNQHRLACSEVAYIDSRLKSGEITFDDLLAPGNPVWQEIPTDLSARERYYMAMGFMRGVIARATHDAVQVYDILKPINLRRGGENKQHGK